MKRVALFLVLALTAASCCKKNETEPEGPTDVRIFNATNQTFDNVLVKTTDSPDYSEVEYNYGTIGSSEYSDYHRFDIAHTEADITLTIGGIVYSTPATDFTYLTYIGQDRITFRITVSDEVNHVLDIQTVIEEPIDDL